MNSNLNGVDDNTKGSEVDIKMIIDEEYDDNLFKAFTGQDIGAATVNINKLLIE